MDFRGSPYIDTYLRCGLPSPVPAVPVYPDEQRLLPGAGPYRVLQLRDVLEAVQRAHPVVVVTFSRQKYHRTRRKSGGRFENSSTKARSQRPAGELAVPGGLLNTHLSLSPSLSHTTVTQYTTASSLVGFSKLIEGSAFDRTGVIFRSAEGSGTVGAQIELQKACFLISFSISLLPTGSWYLLRDKKKDSSAGQQIAPVSAQTLPVTCTVPPIPNPHRL